MGAFLLFVEILRIISYVLKRLSDSFPGIFYRKRCQLPRSPIRTHDIRVLGHEFAAITCVQIYPSAGLLIRAERIVKLRLSVEERLIYFLFLFILCIRMFLCSEYEQCTGSVSSKDDWNGPIKVPFRCSDDVVLLVDKKHAREFKALHLDEIHEHGSEIPLPNVSSDILKVIVEYCDNHIPIREQREAAMAAFAIIGGAEYERKLEELEEEESEKYWLHYMKLDYRTLIQLSNAANFLNFQEFLGRMRDALISKVMEMKKKETAVVAAEMDALISKVMEMKKKERAVVAAEMDNLDDELLRDDMDRFFHKKRG